MAVRKSDLQEIYIGTNKVGGVKDITFNTPAAEAIKSETLNATYPSGIAVSADGDLYGLDIEVEIDDEDTNGQVALSTARDNRTTVEANYYPEGKSSGNKEFSGDAFVLSKPSIGGQGKNVVQTGTYRLVYKVPPTEGTV